MRLFRSGKTLVARTKADSRAKSYKLTALSCKLGGSDFPGHSSGRFTMGSMAQVQETAVLLLAHGTPDTLGEIGEYLSRVVGGRPMPQEVVEELKHRYAAIGLKEKPGEEPPPLTKWTLAQGRALEQTLARAGRPLSVYVAMRNWHPLIGDVVRRMRAEGVKRVIAVCLAPQNSRTSVGLYRRALMAAVDEGGAEKIGVTFVEEWPEEPALIEAFARRLAEAYAPACAEMGGGSRLPVLFTAHSVPERTLAASGELDRKSVV